MNNHLQSLINKAKQVKTKQDLTLSNKYDINVSVRNQLITYFNQDMISSNPTIDTFIQSFNGKQEGRSYAI